MAKQKPVFLYKSVVKAYVMKNGKKTYVRTSPMVHAYTSGGTKNYTNSKSVTVKRRAYYSKPGRHTRSRQA